MYGNVWEVVRDDLTYPDPAPAVPVVDPVGAVVGQSRRVRGGSYVDAVDAMRSAERSSVRPREAFFNQGFRLVRSLP